jgi:hypothetical protein
VLHYVLTAIPCFQQHDGAIFKSTEASISTCTGRRSAASATASTSEWCLQQQRVPMQRAHPSWHPQLCEFLPSRCVSFEPPPPQISQSSIAHLEMLLLWALVLIPQNAASAAQDPEVAWFSAPNFRGTWDLIVSCVLTLVICVWSALHLNVPVDTSRLRERNTRRLRWVLLGIFAPEVVVSTAFAQFLTARWLRNEIRADIKYRNKDKVSWI